MNFGEMLAKITRRYRPPFYIEFVNRGDVLSSPDEIVDNMLLNLNIVDAKYDYFQEFQKVETELYKRYESISDLHYPLDWKIENNSSKLIYYAVRLLKPRKIIETGVANGHSSYFILKALENNGLGKLHSIDISPDVGNLVPNHLRNRWSLHLLDRDNYEDSFRSKIKSIGNIDFFLHDSDHSYRWQTFEYSTILPFINKGGVLMSDDVDSSCAFITFIDVNCIKPVFFSDHRKMIGVVKI